VSYQVPKRPGAEVTRYRNVYDSSILVQNTVQALKGKPCFVFFFWKPRL